MATELNLRFPDANHSIVSFDGTESAANEFVNPLTDEDHRDNGWYVETYGAHSLGDPDDQQAARIAGRLPVLYQAGNDVPMLSAGVQPSVPSFNRDPTGSASTGKGRSIAPHALPVGSRLNDSPAAQGIKRGLQHNVPPAPEAGFFGRRKELWQIERWFAGPTRRITITGFGGQGKTALAQEAGRWLVRAGQFQAAVFVDYARIQSLDAVAVAVSNIGAVLQESLLDAAVGWSAAGGSRVLCTTRRPEFGHAAYRIEGTLVHRRIPLAGLGSRRAPDELRSAQLAGFGQGPWPRGFPSLTIRSPSSIASMFSRDMMKWTPGRR
jgi:hypothetical protein